jgi:acetyl-CoA carboxylase biotin carboxyl carrier protein
MEGKGSRRVTAKAALENGTLEAQEISVEHIQRLVRLLDNSDVTELEVRTSATGLRLALRKARAGAEEALVLEPELEEEAEGQAATTEETRHTIVSPWVGIFHPWARPRGGPLVQVGDQVKVGQPVATVEALNVINEVEASVAGRVTEILVEDGAPVEYGQPLLVIDSLPEA